MQFTLQTLLLSFVVVASALAAFEGWGLLVAAILLGMAAYVRCHHSPRAAAWRVFSLLGIVGLIALGFWESVDLREGFRRHDCGGYRMKAIVLALHHYHDDHGHFPPAYVLGPDGKPWHSWRTLILPYLEKKALFANYRFDEPWNGPNNRKLLSADPGCFTCPSDETHAPGHTNYVAVVGPETMWPGAKPLALSENRDGTSRTVFVVETKGSKIAWSEPRDLTFEEACRGVNPEEPNAISAHHPRGDYYHVREPVTVIALGDGTSRCLPATTAPETWRALLTRDGGEEVDLEWRSDEARLHWGHFGGLICLALSTLLLILRPIRRATESHSAASSPATNHTS